MIINESAGIRLWTFVSTFPIHMSVKNWPAYVAWYFRVWPVIGGDPK